MRPVKYVPNEDLLKESVALQDDYNNFVRNLSNKTISFEKVRLDMAHKYLKGRGVEIGGFHAPNALPEGCTADYIDQATIAELKNRFPEMMNMYCVYPSIIDNGEILSKIDSEKYDFLIANHMLEHTENLFKTMQNHLRVIKKGGILLYAIPDKQYTFDIDRELTTYEHLKVEYYEGSEKFRFQHYLDFHENVEKLSGDALIKKTEESMKDHLDTHFHVWTPETFLEHMQQAIKDNILNMEIVEHVCKVELESITVLRKI